MKKQKTDWFDGSVLPVRNGVYQVYIFGRILFAKFKNGIWYSANPFAEFAASSGVRSRFKTHYGFRPQWRGLVK